MIKESKYNEMVPLLGTMTDRDAAEALGISRRVVIYYRKKLGIPAFRRYRWDDRSIEELGEYFTQHGIAECAEHFGMTENSLQYTMSRLRKEGHCIPYQTKENRRPAGSKPQNRSTTITNP